MCTIQEQFIGNTGEFILCVPYQEQFIVIEGEFILCVPYQEQFIGNRRRIHIMCTIPRTVYR